MHVGVGINILFFFGMGIIALIKPRGVVWFVSIETGHVDTRNEIRGVYGGFGLAIAGVLAGTHWYPEIRSGVLVTVAAALFGMAGGRIVSTLIERPGPWPIGFIFMEAGLAGLLVAAL